LTDPGGSPPTLRPAGEAKDAAPLSTLSGAAKLAGVIGWPVAHSLSPRLHGLWLHRHGIDGAYIPLAVRPEHLADALAALPKLGFRGVNLTVPHKQQALALVHDVTPAARRIGAINTIVIAADGTMTGSNTDVFGFRESLRQAQPQWQGGQGTAVVIGAGGAARAVVVALIEAGVAEIRLVNRTPARAMALVADLGGPVRVVPWADRTAALADATLLVNTTTLGMQHQPPLHLSLDRLPPQAIVCDIVYVPAETPLLAAARARGNPCVGGIGMLLHQARPGFAAWFGPLPEITADLPELILGRGAGPC